MEPKLPDAQVSQLIKERKVLPDDWEKRLTPRVVQDFQQRKARLEIVGSEGNSFQIIIRENMINKTNFSVILAYQPLGSTEWIRLRRYNGPHSTGHRNRVEGERVQGYHIHEATERYQKQGFRVEGYAYSTTRFAGRVQALDCLLRDCTFEGRGLDTSQGQLL